MHLDTPPIRNGVPEARVRQDVEMQLDVRWRAFP